MIHSELENDNRHGEDEHDIELMQRNARPKRVILCELGCLASEVRLCDWRDSLGERQWMAYVKSRQGVIVSPDA